MQIYSGYATLLWDVPRGCEYSKKNDNEIKPIVNVCVYLKKD